MEKLTNDQVQKALREWLGPDAVIEVSRDAPKSRMTGWIMHPAFKKRVACNTAGMALGWLCARRT